MRITLFASLSVFVMLSLILMWSFQLFMLDTFYYQSVRGRISSAATQIAAAYDKDHESFSKSATAAGLNNDFCIFAFNASGNPVAKVHSDAGCIIHAVNGEALTAMYDKALQNGGEHIERASLAGFAQGKNNNPLSYRKYSLRDRVLYVSVRESDKGPIIIIIDAAVSPGNVIKGALLTQHIIITIIMVLVTAVVSNTIAKKLSQPIADVNKAAKRLTVGEYDVEFTGDGYREIYELSDTLNHTAKELKKTELMQKELIANISHDLRTPLTLITGYCEMMRDIEGENNPENMQVVLDETARLSSLVNDLVDLSKYQSGNESFEKESIDMDALLIETVDRYRKLMQGKDYTFIYESVGQTYAMCDQKRILQVIYNLINNAINYAGDDKTVILKLLTTAEGRVRIEVIDHGMGIAKEDLPMIFDRYYKVDKVHKRAVTGTGLGLSIVKEILEKHGAVYGVQSELGEGSIFYFEL